MISSLYMKDIMPNSSGPKRRKPLSQREHELRYAMADMIAREVSRRDLSTEEVRALLGPRAQGSSGLN